MKGLNLKSLICAMLVFVGIATTNVYATHNANAFTRIKGYADFNFVDVVNVIDSYVPKECRKAFYMATACEDEMDTLNLRLQILAIGYYESGWKKIVSDKPNKDGSWDLGYLQLNSKNLKNTWFMERFAPSFETKTDLELYLAVCVNLYKMLYNRYGEEAVYAYNAGEGRYLDYKAGKKTLPNTTLLYRKKVSNYTKTIYNEMVAARVKRYNDRVCSRHIPLEISKGFGLIYLSNDYCSSTVYMDVLRQNGKRHPVHRIDYFCKELNESEEERKRIIKNIYSIVAFLISNKREYGASESPALTQMLFA